MKIFKLPFISFFFTFKSLIKSIFPLQAAHGDNISLEKKIAELEKELLSLKQREDEVVKTKFSQVLTQFHARFSRTGVINSHSGFRLG